MESIRPEKVKRWPEALIILQSVIYGFGDPISKIALEVTPVYTMLTVRYGIAFLVCLLFFRKRICETLKAVPVKAWLVPGMCIGLSYLLNNVALSLTEATSVAFLRSLSVVITPAFSFILYRNRYRWQHIVMQILVLPGMYLLCIKGGLSGFGAGEIFSLLAAALMAGALVFSRNYLDMVDPISMTALQAACSTILALGGSLMIEGGIHLENTDLRAWLIILYLAVLCTFLGFLMQNLALTRIDERRVSLIQCICPVMTAIFSFILLMEQLSIQGVIGATIIIGCIIAGSIGGSEKNAFHAVKD